MKLSASGTAAMALLACLGCGPGRVPAPSADSEAVEKLRAALVSAGGAAGEEAADATVAAGGSGWATLRGRFTFAGVTGQPKALVVDKDTEVCSKAGVKLLDRSLLVDPSTKGIANVVIFARKASRSKPPAAESTGPPAVFDQKNCEFLSPVFAARVGQEIEVRNSDPIGHNTNIAGSSFNQLIPAGGGTIYKPDAETGMPTMVTCNIHPWMKAYAVFRKDGYVAVSGADGAFAIADLPAGELIEFQVWHERSSGPNGAVGIEKPELKWTSKGRFQIQLAPDEVKDLGTLEIPAAAIGI